MLYIESPLGSGFSINTSKPIQSFHEECAVQKQIYTWLLNKYKSWKTAEWIFCGESYAGLAMCKIIKALHEEFQLKFKGLFMMAPVIDAKVQINNFDQYSLFKKSGFFSCFGLCNCCSSSSNEDLKSLPLVLKRKDSTKAPQVSPMNDNKGDVNSDDLFGYYYIDQFITSELFHRLISYKPKVTSKQDEIKILKQDKNPNCYVELGYILDLGINVEIVIGEGDYILPLKQMLTVLHKVKF